MNRDRPPFRADHVGSYLRPHHLIEARERRARGELSTEDLREIEDEAIRKLARRQEEVGLRGITDGEFRRTFFHVDFLEQLDGVSVKESGFAATFRRDDGTEVGFKPPTMHVTAPIRHSRSIQGRDFEFLSTTTTRTPKVCIPSPSMLHFRGGRQAISGDVYPSSTRSTAISPRRIGTRSWTSRRAAAAICSWTTPTSRIFATTRSASRPGRAATTRTSCRAFTAG